ncbi:hypothetical protein CPB84DRAFT_1783045, partial [Gymnopilus junonius]
MAQFPEEHLDLSSSEGFEYFPAYPGHKVYQSCYELIRKLGYGPRSSVWLILDPQFVFRFCVRSLQYYIRTVTTANGPKAFFCYQDIYCP